MEIIPAIDIRNGKCVRLFKGDYAIETVYADDPVAIAKKWQALGARSIHIIDLDGAKTGNITILPVLVQILANINIPVQFGGGIRNYETAKKLLDLGVEKIILSTAALEDYKLVKRLVAEFKDRVVISLDLEDGVIKKSGWTTTNNSAISTIKIIEDLQAIGIKNIIFTDINKDGTMSGPSYTTISQLRKIIKCNFIVAGGISDIGQIERLNNDGVDAVIIGKALYENKIDLSKAIKKC